MRTALLLVMLAMPASAWSQPRAAKTVADLVADLRSPDARARYSTALNLADMAEMPEKAVPGLARLLTDPSAILRQQAAKTLASYGEDAAPAAPALVKALADPDPLLRKIASETLGKIGEKATSALIAGLKDVSPNVRLAVVQALDANEQNAETIAALGGVAAGDKHVTVRRVAYYVLSKVGLDQEAVQKSLLVGLHDKDSVIRVGVATMLLDGGKEYWVHLVTAASDPSAEVRSTMFQALASKVGELEEVHIQAFRKGLEDSDVKVRQVAVWAVGKMQTKARELGGGKEMFKALAKLVSDKDVVVRRSAIWALGQVGIDELEELAQLVKGMKDADANTRGTTVQALAQYLHDDTPASYRREIHAALADGLRDNDRRVQSAAAELLGKEGKSALPVLAQVVQSGKGPARLWGAHLLGELGADAKDAVPLLEKMSKESTPEGRAIAKAALQKIDSR